MVGSMPGRSPLFPSMNKKVLAQVTSSSPHEPTLQFLPIHLKSPELKIVNPAPVHPPAPTWPPGGEPKFPSLDPVDLSILDLPPNDEAIPRPSDKELDDLFYTEARQVRHTGGLRTWEFDCVWPAGENAFEPVQPDESEWFHVFCRSHWHNTTHNVLESDPELKNWGFTPQDTWSVENPRIWKTLARVIDLAYRMLDAAAEGEWLQNMLLMRERIQVLRRAEDDQFINSKIPLLSDKERLTAGQVRAMLRSCKPFHRKIQWALLAEHEGAQHQSRAGVTLTHPVIFIAIEVTNLATLLKVDPESMAAARTRMKLASTMVHELTHAMVAVFSMDMMHREAVTNGVNHGWSWNEPFYGNENLAECGHSHTHSIFNGELGALLPSHNAPYHPDFLAGQVCTSSPWPEMDQERWAAGDCPALPAEPATKHLALYGYGMHVVPGDWVRWIQSAGFWAHCAAKYGREALHAPRVFRSRRLVSLGPFRYSYATMAEADERALLAQPAEVRPHLARAVRRLEVRREQWRRLRPWYAQTRLRWSLTPHSAQHRRRFEKLESEILALPRSLRKEHDAANIIMSMVPDDSWFDVVASQDGVIRPDQWMFRVEHNGGTARMRCVKSMFYAGMGRMARAVLPPTKAKVTQGEIVDRRISMSRPAGWRDDPCHPYELPQKEYHLITSPGFLRHIVPPVKIAARHMDGPLPPDSARMCHLTYGHTVLRDWFLCAPFVSVGVQTACEASHADLSRQLLALMSGGWQGPMGDGWLDFRFKLPAWADRFDICANADATLSALTAEAGADIARWGPLTQWVEGESVFDVWSGLPVDHTLDADVSVLAAKVVDETEVRYVTVAQLYDLRLEVGESLLVRNGWDIEVYRLEDAMRVLGVPRQALSEALEASPYGPVLGQELSSVFVAMLKEEQGCFRALAKVIQWVSREEVALRDGTRGNSLWIYAHNSVYDLTNLRLEPEEKKLDQALKSKPGNNPMFEVLLAGHRPYEVVQDIAHLKVGMLPPIGLDSPPAPPLAFTAEDLGWHQFRETGMLIQIYDDVYDIGSEFIDQHPGGEKILAGVAGRDATALFEKYHPNNAKELLDSVRSLKVGRMVKTYSPDSVLKMTETRLLSRVYDNSPLEGVHEYGTLHAHWRGQDVSRYPEEWEEENPDPWAARLWNEGQHLIVGKFATPNGQLPGMSVEQLAQHDGTRVDRHTEKAYFTAVDDVVMDVTTLMRYGPKAVTEKLMPYIGQTVTDGGVGWLLREQYGFRAVAMLTEGKTADVEWDPRRLRDMGAAQLQGLVAKLQAKEPKPGKDSADITLLKKAKAVDLTDAAKRDAEKAARDARYPVPMCVDRASRKRTREVGAPVPTCAEMTRALRETTRQAVEASKKEMMLKADQASGTWAEEVERECFETRNGNGSWTRAAGPKRVRV